MCRKGSNVVFGRERTYLMFSVALFFCRGNAKVNPNDNSGDVKSHEELDGNDDFIGGDKALDAMKPPEVSASTRKSSESSLQLEETL